MTRPAELNSMVNPTIGRSDNTGAPLPIDINNQLAASYDLDDLTLSALMYVSKQGWFVGKSAIYFRVFDPALIVGSDRMTRYRDLDAQPQAVLFEGMVMGRLTEISDLREEEE